MEPNQNLTTQDIDAQADGVPKMENTDSPSGSQASEVPQSSIDSAERPKSDIPSFISTSLDTNPKKERIPFSKVIKIYMLPIITLVLFLGIIFFLITGPLSTLFANFDRLTEKGVLIESLDQEIADLQALSTQGIQTNRYLVLINQIVPTESTAIAAFQQKIINLAKSHDLRVSEAETQEQLLSDSETGIGALGIIEIPSKFSVNGSLLDLREFVIDIQGLPDFTIIGEMEMDRDTTNLDTWTLDIILIKYQFQKPDQNNKLDEIYRRVPVTSRPDPEILELIER